jgi:DNA repair photolyase
MGYDDTPTREIIKIIKETGNHVQILTKNGTAAVRDFDLLDESDWFGITYTGYEIGKFEERSEAEPFADTPRDRLKALWTANKLGIKTWISAEPVLNAEDIITLIDLADYVNLYKVGKLNYHPSDINWKDFGERVERALKVKKRWRSDFDYYIKKSLRVEMEKE